MVRSNAARKLGIMNNDVSENRGKRRFFPSWGGIFAGLIPGVVALINHFSDQCWIMYNLILVVGALGFAAVNLVGLAVVWMRRFSPPGSGL